MSRYNQQVAQPQRILVTGGAGYIGSHTVHLLLQQGYEVTVVDNLSKGHKSAVPASSLCRVNLADTDALTELMRETEGVLEKPKPIAATLGYGDSSVKYRLIYWTAEQNRWPVRNELVTRIWYLAKRHGFTMPYPVHVVLQHQQERPFTAAHAEGADLLAQFPRLPEIPPEDRERTRTLTFGVGERLFDEGDDLAGVYFVVSGAVSLQMIRNHQVSEIATIHPGEFCGETGMHGHQAANLRAVALEDTTVVVIAPDVVRHLFEASPRLASETGRTLEVHRKALHAARTGFRQHRSG